jgi:two-component system, NarL family, sensor histidine kinase LiaS
LADFSNERSRIARELHDGIAQELAAIGYALDSEIGRSDTSAESRTGLRSIREQVTGLNKKIRDEIFRLRSIRDDVHSHFLSALDSLPVDTQVIGALPDSEKGLELGKVLIELARNAVDHGRATFISLEIEESKIEFENNGVASGPIQSERYGLVGAVERLDLIGWSLNIESGFARATLNEMI